MGLRLLANPAVRQNRHEECLTRQSERIKLGPIISVDDGGFTFLAVLVTTYLIRSQLIPSCATFVRA